MAFHDVSFPANIGIGLLAPTRWRTDIVAGRSGHESRNSPAAHARRRYEARVPPGNLTAGYAVLDFFHGRRGPLYSFRLEDPQDHKSSAVDAAPAATDQTLGTGDAATAAFQLVKVYDALGPAPYTRTITKPQSGSVKVSLDGVEQASGWSVNLLTGVVTFDMPPGAGVVVAAGFRFDVPVRFEDEELPAGFAVGDDDDDGSAVVEYDGVPMIEVRE